MELTLKGNREENGSHLWREFPQSPRETKSQQLGWTTHRAEKDHPTATSWDGGTTGKSHWCHQLGWMKHRGEKTTPNWQKETHTHTHKTTPVAMDETRKHKKPTQATDPTTDQTPPGARLAARGDRLARMSDGLGRRWLEELRRCAALREVPAFDALDLGLEIGSGGEGVEALYAWGLQKAIRSCSAFWLFGFLGRFQLLLLFLKVV